jgi:NADPH:quinone reductase-like Zn-dependent oxidoreductase
VSTQPAFRPDAAAAALESLGWPSRRPTACRPAAELTALIDGGQLRVPPIASFPLERTGAALVEMAAGHVRGKLVIAVR